MDQQRPRRPAQVTALSAVLVVHGMLATILVSVPQGLVEIALAIGLACGVPAARAVAIGLAVVGFAAALWLGLAAASPAVGDFVDAALALATLVVLSTREAAGFFRRVDYRAAEPST